MRMTDRIIQNQNQNRLQGERQTDLQQDDADEMGYAYRPAPPQVFLNENHGVFYSKDTTSINTAPSVFEKTTVFHVNQSE
ncbi:MAG: hypothetical protein IJ679_06765 [Lachnospiraceae bacterium]|nr:hypothetical protein [Lachnospiraceae bacterium]